MSMRASLETKHASLCLTVITTRNMHAQVQPYRSGHIFVAA
jgi:hypothetical protein